MASFSLSSAGPGNEIFNVLLPATIETVSVIFEYVYFDDDIKNFLKFI